MFDIQRVNSARESILSSVESGKLDEFTDKMKFYTEEFSHFENVLLKGGLVVTLLDEDTPSDYCRVFNEIVTSAKLKSGDLTKGANNA